MLTFESLYRSAVQDVLLRKGEYFERLTAIVHQALEAEKLALHNIKAVGATSGVPHQLDVVLVGPGNKHIEHIVECKDHSDSSTRVGLSEIRNFFAVAHDVGADAATLVSSTGFTQNAIEFAKRTPYASNRFVRLGILSVDPGLLNRATWHEREIGSTSMVIPPWYGGLGPKLHVVKWRLPQEKFHPALAGRDLETTPLALSVATEGRTSVCEVNFLEQESVSSSLQLLLASGITGSISLSKQEGGNLVALQAIAVPSAMKQARVLDLTIKGRYRLTEEVRTRLVFEFVAKNSSPLTIPQEKIEQIGHTLFK